MTEFRGLDGEAVASLFLHVLPDVAVTVFTPELRIQVSRRIGADARRPRYLGDRGIVRPGGVTGTALGHVRAAVLSGAPGRVKLRRD